MAEENKQGKTIIKKNAADYDAIIQAVRNRGTEKEEVQGTDTPPLEKEKE
ncbi:MAG: hypothetical protein WC624_00300 [Candidatus Margulisiibacteriota bacterium]